MAIQKTEKIWHNGQLIPWDDAKLHVMSHVVNYGSSVFEGVRCYQLPTGPAIFRANEHIQRLLDSAKIYRIDVDFTREELVAGHDRPDQEQWRLALLHPPHHSARIRRSGCKPLQLVPPRFTSPIIPGENISAPMPSRASTSASLPGPA